jgi:hypothetical protein
MPLSPSQAKAVACTGIQQILAGPGSGKTRVITETQQITKSVIFAIPHSPIRNIPDRKSPGKTPVTGIKKNYASRAALS